MTPLQSFLDTLGAGPAAEETYDLSLYEALDEADRAEADRELEARARRQRDVRAALTLAAVGADGAAEVVEDLAMAPVGDFARVLLARAAGRLRPGVAVVPDLVVQLASPSKYARFGACKALAEHDVPMARSALRQALADAEPLVRTGAFNALVAMQGLESLTLDADGNDHILSPLRVLELRLRHALSSVATPARGQFLRILDGETEGLAYQPGTPPVDRRSVGRAIAKRAGPLPMDELLATTGHDRDWVEALLLARLSPEIGDERVVAALDALDVVGREDAFAEVRPSLDGDHPLAVLIDSRS